MDKRIEEQTRAIGREQSDAVSGTAGACFGFGVRSELDFRFLRQGTGDPLDIYETDRPPDRLEEPLLQWERFGGLPISARLQRIGDVYSLWVEGMGWYHVDPYLRSVGVPRKADVVMREERLWGIPAAICCLARGDLPIHAAAIDIDGRAVLLAAPGQFGKTTLAGAFMRAGYRILAEDTTCCSPWEAPFVRPGPAMLRVRRDAFGHFDFPGTEVLANEPNRVHLAMEGDARGTGEAVEIAAVVFLRPSEDVCHIEAVRAAAAVPDVFALTFKLPLDESRARCFEGSAHLVSSVPVWNLHRPLRFDNLAEAVDRVVSTCIP
jgi:hypothetical protein